MNNRVFLILLAAVLALSMGLVGCGGGQVPETTEYNLTISSTAGGSVTNPGEDTYTYDAGEVVNLVAGAEEGYYFVNWAGDVDTIVGVNDAATTIIMNNHYSITAIFALGIPIPLKNPDSFIQMTIGDPDSLDPAWGYDTASGEQLQYIYETLLFYDGEEIEEFVPVLATEWELLDDNVTYRFKIREGVKFHEDGDLTPEDVEYSFERAMVQDRFIGPAWLFYQPLLDLNGSRDGDGSIQVTFDQINSAVEVDGGWVVFNLVDPIWGLAFLQILCGPWASIVDKEWCVANGEWDGTEETWEDYNNPDRGKSYLYDHTNGTGPWKLEEWDPGVEIRLVRNDDYWREPAAFETVITQVVEEWTVRKEALLAGDADLVRVPRDRIGELEGIVDLTVYQDLPQTPLSIEAFFFNMVIAEDSTYIGSGTFDGNGIPPDFFTDLDVRKGFSYAFDWETYIDDAYMGEAEQRGSPIIEGLLFYNPDASMYSLDLDKAEEHLRLAWDGQLWEKGFKFTLLYSTGHLPRETACKILAENLLAVNPKFQLSIQPSTTYNSEIWSTHMPMFQIGWAADYPDPNNFMFGFMASYGVFAQFQGYSNSHVDDLIAQGISTTDTSERQAVYYELQEIYYEDAPGIMLVQPLGRRYFTKYIEGFYFNPFISGEPGPLYYMNKAES